MGTGLALSGSPVWTTLMLDSTFGISSQRWHPEIDQDKKTGLRVWFLGSGKDMKIQCV